MMGGKRKIHSLSPGSGKHEGKRQNSNRGLMMGGRYNWDPPLLNFIFGRGFILSSRTRGGRRWGKRCKDMKVN